MEHADKELKAWLVKASRWAAQRERSKSETEARLRSWGLDETWIAEVMDYLTQEGFVDEDRYSRAFVHDHFRFQSWGKIRLRAELQARQVPDAAIRAALQQISAEEYSAALDKLLIAKRKQWGGLPKEVQYAKLRTFAARKGYEADWIYNRLKLILAS